MTMPAAGEIAYVSVEIVGVNGVVESNADEMLEASVEGGELIAFGSAQPAPTDSYLDGAFASYRGFAMAVVRRVEPGVARLTVKGLALAPASTDIVFEQRS